MRTPRGTLASPVCPSCTLPVCFMSSVRPLCTQRQLLRYNDNNSGVHGAQVFSFGREMYRTGLEDIRCRLRLRLREKAMTAADLAGLTGHGERVVQGWLEEGSTRKIRADFLGKCEEAGFASARWLLTGLGPRDPDATDALRLTVIERVIAGAVDQEELQALATSTAAADRREAVRRSIDRDEGDEGRRPDRRTGTDRRR